MDDWLWQLEERKSAGNYRNKAAVLYQSFERYRLKGQGGLFLEESGEKYLSKNSNILAFRHIN